MINHSPAVHRSKFQSSCSAKPGISWQATACRSSSTSSSSSPRLGPPSLRTGHRSLIKLGLVPVCSFRPSSLLLELDTPDRLKYILLLWRLTRQFTWAPPTMRCWAPDKKPPAGGSSATLLRAPMPETRVPDDAAVLSLMDNGRTKTTRHAADKL
jgi:hypothetical protein